MPPASLPSYTKSSRPALQGFSLISSFNRLRKSEAWRFARMFAKLVLIPAVAAILIVEVIAWRTGATVTSSVADIAELQHRDPDIVWTGAGQLYGPLALARIKIEQPEIAMIGHSRCGQMRSMMFKPYTFHNSCVVAWTLSQIKNMIDLATRAGGPKTIMFTLDYFMLGDKYADRWQEKAFMDFAPPQRSHRDGLLNLATEFKLRPGRMLAAMPSYLFGRAHESANGLELLGPDAIAVQGGFRSDGSLLYNPETLAQAPVARQEPPRLIATVQDGDGVQPGAAQMQALKEIGELGKQRHLTLIGIQLPIIQQTVNILDSNSDWNGYRVADRGTWRLMRSPQMRQKLKEMGINFFDMSHDPVDNEPRAFVDPAHPSEYGIGMALLDAMKNDPQFRALLPRVDLSALQAALETAKRQGRFFNVYGGQF